MERGLMLLFLLFFTFGVLLSAIPILALNGYDVQALLNPGAAPPLDRPE